MTPRWTIERPPPPVIKARVPWTPEQVAICVEAANGMVEEGGSDMDSITACILAVGKQPCEIYSRVVGYIRPVQGWNKGRVEEYQERRTLDKKEGG